MCRMKDCRMLRGFRANGECFDESLGDKEKKGGLKVVRSWNFDGTENCDLKFRSF